MAQIKTPTSNFESHGVQTEYEPNSQANHPYRHPSPSAPPTPFPTQNQQTILTSAAGWPMPQGPQIHGHAIYQQHGPYPQATFLQPLQATYPPSSYPQNMAQQPPQATYPLSSYPQNMAQQPPPSSYPQNTAQQPCAPGPGYEPHPQANCQAPPQYVVMAPHVASGVLQPIEGWNTGLLDCMDDPTNALITVCFPCVTFGQVAEIVDQGRTSCATNAMLYGLIAFLIGFPCILTCGYRTKLRNNFRLPESPAPDWAIHLLCEYCALCQEYRELHQRGLDPSIGWHGNLERRRSMQQQQYVMMAPMNQTMVA